MGIKVYKGYWWLPSSSDNQVAGTLTISPDGSLLLELYGGFGLDKDGIGFERKKDSVVYGRCYAPDRYMKDISLFDCYSAISLNLSSSFPITRYTCRYALIGFHSDSLKTPSFFEAHIDFEELAFWCPPKNIITQLNESSLTISLDTNHDNEVLASLTLNDGLLMNLKQGGSYLPNYPTVRIEQSTYLDIEKEGISCIDVLDSTRLFERFLSLAMLYPIEHGRIKLRSRDCFQTLEDGKPYYHPIEFVTFLYRGEKTESRVKYPDMLFNYNDVADCFKEMYNRFYSEQSIAQIWSNLIDSLEKKRVFTSNDFLVVAQALDGFAIRFRREQKFLLELQDLKSEFAGIKRVQLSDDDLKQANGSRNYYSHILKLEKKEQKLALEGAKLFSLTRKLRVLLICCVLSFMGIENAKIDELLNKCNNSLLRS